MGLFCKIADLVFNNLNIKTMSSTVNKLNTPSVKAHQKAKCFKPIPKDREAFLRKHGFLKDEDIRFEYIGNRK